MSSKWPCVPSGTRCAFMKKKHLFSRFPLTHDVMMRWSLVVMLRYWRRSSLITPQHATDTSSVVYFAQCVVSRRRTSIDEIKTPLYSSVHVISQAWEWVHKGNHGASQLLFYTVGSDKLIKAYREYRKSCDQGVVQQMDKQCTACNG